MHLWHTSDGGGGGGTAASAGASSAATSWGGVGGADVSDAAGCLCMRMWVRKARCEANVLGQLGHWILVEGVSPASVDSAMGAGVVVSDAPWSAGCAASIVSGSSSASMVAGSSSASMVSGSSSASFVSSSSAACAVMVAGSASDDSIACFRADEATAITRLRVPRWLFWFFCSFTMAVTAA